jgi:hypothetical protein
MFIGHRRHVFRDTDPSKACSDVSFDHVFQIIFRMQAILAAVAAMDGNFLDGLR